MTKIWECVVDNGIRQYFDNQAEADFFTKDAVRCGFGVRVQEIALPLSAQEFADFMNRQFESQRGVILAIRRAADRA